ncbi:MAG: hypothetical protein HY554_04370 [Elusimicrobia bacterium]|nr:hypothetical protein [Elusimicrobiota bacterium]
MDEKQSLYLIMLLLVALLFGPVIVLTQDRDTEQPLKPIPPQERIVDAPASLPGSLSPLPDVRGGSGRLFPR